MHGVSQIKGVEGTIIGLTVQGFYPPKYFSMLSMLFMKKKDESMVLFVDYQQLNMVIVCNKYPLPHINNLSDQFQGVLCLSKIDLHFGYHQLKVKEVGIPTLQEKRLLVTDFLQWTCGGSWPQWHEKELKSGKNISGGKSAINSM